MTNELGEVLQSSSSSNAVRLNQFLAEYQTPSLEEGFHKLIVVCTFKYLKIVSNNPMIVAVNCSLWPYLFHRLTIQPTYSNPPDQTHESSPVKTLASALPKVVPVKLNSSSGQTDVHSEFLPGRRQYSSYAWDAPKRKPLNLSPAKKSVNSMSVLFSSLHINSVCETVLTPSEN